MHTLSRKGTYPCRTSSLFRTRIYRTGICRTGGSRRSIRNSFWTIYSSPDRCSRRSQFRFP